MFYDSRWFHAHDDEAAFPPARFRAISLSPPRQPPWTPRSSLRRAPFTAFSCISTLKSAHPEGCVREKTAGTGFDTYGSLWKRTDSGMEKGGGRSDRLGGRGNFSRELPIPKAARHFQRSSVLYPVRQLPDALPPSRIPTHTDCSYNQYKRHSKATVPPRTASRFSLASS